MEKRARGLFDPAGTAGRPGMLPLGRNRWRRCGPGRTANSPARLPQGGVNAAARDAEPRASRATAAAVARMRPLPLPLPHASWHGPAGASTAVTDRDPTEEHMVCGGWGDQSARGRVSSGEGRGTSRRLFGSWSIHTIIHHVLAIMYSRMHIIL